MSFWKKMDTLERLLLLGLLFIIIGGGLAVVHNWNNPVASFTEEQSEPSSQRPKIPVRVGRGWGQL